MTKNDQKAMKSVQDFIEDTGQDNSTEYRSD